MTLEDHQTIERICRRPQLILEAFEQVERVHGRQRQTEAQTERLTGLRTYRQTDRHLLVDVGGM